MNDRDWHGRKHKRGWQQGRSKGHKLPCQLCGGLQHERGKHLSPAVVGMLLAKAEREQARAAACGGQVVQAG